MLSKLMERPMPRYACSNDGNGITMMTRRMTPTETTHAWPAGSRKNWAHVTCYCTEEV